MFDNMVDMGDLAHFIDPVPDLVPTVFDLPEELDSDINRLLLEVYKDIAPMINSALETVEFEFGINQTITASDVRSNDNTVAYLRGKAEVARALFLDAANAGQEAYLLSDAHLQSLTYLEVNWPNWPLPAEAEDVDEEEVQAEHLAEEEVQAEDPDEEAPPTEDPDEEAPPSEDPDEEAPPTEDPDEEAPPTEDPDVEDPDEEDPDEKASLSEAPDEEDPDEKEASSEAPDKKDPDEEGQSENPDEEEEQSDPGHRRCSSCALMVAGAAGAAICIFLMLY